ncbi:serine protease [Massilia sp. Root351]|jgi:S1-C subfamily serine protease|uniref:S1 family peptidase n=1 Tax=Massilia sp. Root351 TaxID=1736522 RepID=UPI0009E95EEF|nr:serine protease [Massilia sp. Root351]
MITANALQRTLHLSINGSTGTGFLLDHGGRQYLITAKHVIGAGASGTFELGIMNNKAWTPVKVSLVGHAAHEADISVLALPSAIVAPSLALPAAKKSHLTQDAYFLGFPYGDFGDVGLLNQNYPMPFVKRSIISSFNNGGRPSIIYLDGHNNPGFSGGPVVIFDPDTKQLEVLSVVSAYRSERKEIQHNGLTRRDLSVKVNTGIVLTYNVLHAIEVIEANPIGPAH